MADYYPGAYGLEGYTSPAPVDTDRTITIPAEDRTVSVDAESRTVTVEAP